MLSAEAVRLVAIETLCPTAAALAGTGFPTLAGPRVFDSRAASLQDLDRDRAYTPVLALYTHQSTVALMGSATDATDTEANCVLDVIAELAVAARDEGGEFPDAMDAMADSDPNARLVLAALCAQVRMLLMHSQHGGLWRKLVKHVVDIDQQTFSVPDFGLRYHRVGMRFRLTIADDRFDIENGGLPEPIKSVYEALPAASYASTKLAELSAAFAGEPRTPLTSAHVTTGPITSGPNDL
ncbi:hypothetical protein RHAB21_02522 [Pseudorhizobium halotolerans]|uniref:Uncharacterized protein n=1 Tax=Pseudorhizobium halotolerans TaxID=1233081 RepID=A0ABN7JL10_9HYPH|nr:hypothetical protein [Pseudorhizobium halotolerans]CAD7036420.1 hypothetical protein RHAB21_02522 [Pseudorhizobium halotolerans]